MQILNDISALVQAGKAPKVKGLVNEALSLGIEPEKILNDGLLAGMSVIGEKFKRNEVFVPEVLIAARAMKTGAEILKPHLASDAKAAGTVIIGTVKGDLHDIGKNLVRMMLEGKGLTVIDLGVDVAPDKFVEAAVSNNADIICCSALLTTTMTEMKNVVEKAEEAGIRGKVKIMIGGAPVTEEYRLAIGADHYTPDAATAADVAYNICVSK